MVNVQSQTQKNNALYGELIAGLCRHAKLEDERADILENGHIVLDGVAMTLMHSPVNQYGFVMMYCDYGTLPDRGREEWYRKLLQMNLLTLGGECATGLALNPETERVMLVRQLALNELTVEGLVAQLKCGAMLSKRWSALVAHESGGANNSPDRGQARGGRGR